VAVPLLAAIALAFFGCTSTVTRPPVPADPVHVFLIQDDRHLGLVLPRESGRLVEYGFGDYDWYALGHDAWYCAFDTVLWPTQGTLARRELDAHDGSSLRQRLPWVTVDEIAVERAPMRALLAELDAAFARHADRVHHNAAWGMDFVPHEDGYCCLWNCNDMVADWLERLGCRVSWVPIRLGLVVAGP
jgi:hypothetical protein